MLESVLVWGVFSCFCLGLFVGGLAGQTYAARRIETLKAEVEMLRRTLNGDDELF